MKQASLTRQKGFFLFEWLDDGFCLKNVIRFGLLLVALFVVIKTIPVYQDAYRAAQVLKRVQKTADPFANASEIRESVKTQMRAVGVSNIDVDRSLTVIGRGDKRVLMLDYAYEAKLNGMARLVFDFEFSNASNWKEILVGATVSR